MHDEYIPEGFIRPCSNNVDDIGVTLISGDKVLRAIHQEYEVEVRELLDTGLINELVRKGLFPDTGISNIELDGFPLVLEHKKISPLIYPDEWSPEMLRRAALCVLEVNRLANVYGYELKDAHPYNVVFNYGMPQFVDFGSIVKISEQNYWVAYEEFVNAYCRTLRLAEKGLIDIFKRAFHTNGRSFKGAEIMSATNIIFGFLGVRTTAKLLRLAMVYRMGPAISEEAIAQRLKNRMIRRMARHILKSKLLPLRKVDYQSLEKKIKSYRFGGESEWGDYQSRSGMYATDEKINLTPRMCRVVDIVKELAPRSVLELAGNQGVLSRALSALPGIEQVVCSDYDEDSIDQLLLRIGDDKVFPAHFDFMSGVRQSIHNERADRLKSDLVIALAVTHHLLLSQHFSPESIFSRLSLFTKRYVIIEFMPLGLWDGTSAPPLPAWYKETWFSEKMSQYFKIIDRIMLGENRVVYVGESHDYIRKRNKV